MIPMLCRVALATLAPSMSIGSSIATGETFPDLPTCHTTSMSSVTTPSCLLSLQMLHEGDEKYILTFRKLCY